MKSPTSSTVWNKDPVLVTALSGLLVGSTAWFLVTGHGAELVVVMFVEALKAWRDAGD